MPVATGADTGGGGGGGGAPAGRRGGSSSAGSPTRSHPATSAPSYSDLPTKSSSYSSYQAPAKSSRRVVEELTSMLTTYGDDRRGLTAPSLSYGDGHRTEPAPAPITLDTLSSQSSTADLLGIGDKKPAPQQSFGDFLSQVGGLLQSSADSRNTAVDPMGQTTLTNPKEVDLANEFRQEQHDRQVRRKSLAGKPREPFKPEVEAMTLDEYNALDPQERAAVDFNTMLVRAVRRDKRFADDYEDTTSKLEKKTYEEAVEKTFGEDGGSKRYAPETMALLRQIDFTDQAADLDDFLKLRAAITAKDLQRLDQDPVNPLAPVPAMPEGKADDILLAERLSRGTQDMQETLAKGNELLATMRQTMNVDRSDRVELLGGKPTGINGLGFEAEQWEPDPMTGQMVPSDANTFFRDAFLKLSDTALAKDHKDILAAVYDQTQSQGDWGKFVNYVDMRTSNAELYNAPLGQAEDVDYSSAQKLRNLVGLKPLNRPTGQGRF